MFIIDNNEGLYITIGYIECFDEEDLVVYDITTSNAPRTIRRLNNDIDSEIFCKIYDISKIIQEDYTILDNIGIKYDATLLSVALYQARSGIVSSLEPERTLFELNNKIPKEGYIVSVIFDPKKILFVQNVSYGTFLKTSLFNKKFRTKVFHIFNKDEFELAEECQKFIIANFKNKSEEELRDFHKVCPFIKDDQSTDIDLSGINLN